MIGYTSVGTNDLSKSAKFYDALLAALGAKRVFELDDVIVWSKGNSEPNFSIHTPFDGKKASVGNGVMIALSTKSEDEVRKLYELALSLGASDEGEPGFRAEGFYAAYFRDLDGNKLNFHCMTV